MASVVVLKVSCEIREYEQLLASIFSEIWLLEFTESKMSNVAAMGMSLACVLLSALGSQ